MSCEQAASLIIIAVVFIAYVLIRFGKEEWSDNGETYQLRLGPHWLFCLHLQHTGGTKYRSITVMVFGFACEFYTYPHQSFGLCGEDLEEYQELTSRIRMHVAGPETCLVQVPSSFTPYFYWSFMLMDINMSKTSCTGLVLSWISPIPDSQ